MSAILDDTDDLLGRATRALREAGEPSDDMLRRGRSRLREAARASRRRRARFFSLTLPIAAVLVGTTAWAAGTGRLTSVAREVKALLAPATQTTVSVTPPKVTPTKAVGVAPSRAVVTEPTPSVTPVAAVKHPVVVATQAKKPKAVVSAPPPREDDGGLALYKKAHRLHFDAQHAAALVAWDEYLKAFPSGALAVEARYNRAMCLVRLGRAAEARTALTPFAEGKVAGGYRKSEAAALLDALER